jgi:hypothetical protein
MSFDDVISHAQWLRTPEGASSPTLDLETVLRDYLTAEQLRDLSDAALMQLSATYNRSHHGHSTEVVSKVAGEQQRRLASRSRRAERIATKALGWSRWTFFVSLVAAVAGIAALFRG